MTVLVHSPLASPSLAPPNQPLKDPTDDRLMAIIQSHHRLGLNLLHDRYYLLLKSMSMSVLHNQSDADDLLQEVFVEIWNRASTFDPLKGRPLAWIATLTRRRAIDRLRRREAYERAAERFAEESKRSDQNWSHVQEEIAVREQGAYLQQAMASLPAAQRDTIKLAYYGEMTQREIAARTGIPLGTIKTRLELGLKKMAVCLRGLKDSGQLELLSC